MGTTRKNIVLSVSACSRIADPKVDWPHGNKKEGSGVSDGKPSNNLLSALRGVIPPPPNNHGALSALYFRPEVAGLYFNGKTVALDGFRFVGCRFDNCVLRLNTTSFDIINCVVDAATRVEYSGELAKVMQLFVGRFEWAPQFFPPFFLPTKNPDGSITIVDRSI